MPTLKAKTPTEIAAQFCNVDCRYNPNGCGHCGRTKPIVGVREMGFTTLLSGRRVAAFRELSIAGGRTYWTVYLVETGRPARSANAIRNFLAA